MSFLRNIFSRRAVPGTNTPGPWEFKDGDALHRKLQDVMTLYKFLGPEKQSVIREFVCRFYIGKEVFVSLELDDVTDPLLAVAANAALVGAAQTNYFDAVKWIHLCTDDLEVAGDARGYSTVRLNAALCVDESRYITPGNNVVAHEFAHILDAQLGLSASTEGMRDGFQRYIHDFRNGDVVPIADCFTEFDDTSLDDEGANFHTDVEFFAYASEAFFTNAWELREYHGQLYRDLSSIYGLDLADLDWKAIWQL